MAIFIDSFADWTNWITISLRTWRFWVALKFLWLLLRTNKFCFKLNLNFSELFIKFVVLIHVLRNYRNVVVGDVGEGLLIYHLRWITLNTLPNTRKISSYAYCLLVWVRVHPLRNFFRGLLLHFLLMLAFKVHQRNFSVVPACTRTRSLNFILDIKWMNVRRWRLLETLIMRALILKFAKFAKHSTVFDNFRILKGIRNCCRIIHALVNWMLILKLLNLLDTILAWRIIVIDQDEIFVSVAVYILSIRLWLHVVLVLLLGSCFKQFLPKRAFEC